LLRGAVGPIMPEQPTGADSLDAALWPMARCPVVCPMSYGMSCVACMLACMHMHAYACMHMHACTHVYHIEEVLEENIIVLQAAIHCSWAAHGQQLQDLEAQAVLASFSFLSLPGKFYLVKISSHVFPIVVPMTVSYVCCLVRSPPGDDFLAARSCPQRPPKQISKAKLGPIWAKNHGFETHRLHAYAPHSVVLQKRQLGTIFGLARDHGPDQGPGLRACQAPKGHKRLCCYTRGHGSENSSVEHFSTSRGRFSSCPQLPAMASEINFVGLCGALFDLPGTIF